MTFLLSVCRHCFRYCQTLDGECPRCSHVKIEHTLERLSEIGPGVYVIHGIGTPIYKVGQTADPSARLAGLQSSSPVPLRVVRFFPSDPPMELEKMLHFILDEYRRPGSE